MRGAWLQGVVGGAAPTIAVIVNRYLANRDAKALKERTAEIAAVVNAKTDALHAEIMEVKDTVVNGIDSST